MKIKFGNVHKLRYKVLSTFLSLAVLFTGTGLWYSYVLNNDLNAEAVHPSRDIVYIDSDFYDYYYDCQSDNNTFNEGAQKRPYKYLNQAISNYAESHPAWQYPLYFGQFWIEGENASISSSYYSSSNAATQRAANYTESGESDKGDQGDTLYNFKWSANLAYRPVGGTDSGINSTPQFYAAAQGLVDKTLTDGVPTSGGVKLPYFDKKFLETAQNGKTIAQVYENYEYPFSATDDPVVIGKDLKGNNVGKQVKFGGGYRFDSLSDAVYINTSNRLSAEGTNTTRDTTGQLGFFPFNSNSTTDKTKLNYGVGVKYTINFNLNHNGTIDGEAPCASSSYGTSEDNRAYFTFRGDDDVWVFLDGQLILDMGGGHKNAEGYIDFASKKVGVLYAGDATSNPNTIQGTATSLGINTVTKDFNQLLNYGSSTEDEYFADGKKHTLTMFYMERGMLNSNLFVQFNLPTIPNENMLTVRDEVDVAGVNAGLQNQTKSIADDDAVRYAISNTGTQKSNVHETGLTYPTYDSIRRNNRVFDVDGKLTTLADGTVSSHYENQEVFDNEHVYIDYTSIQSWIENFGKVYAWVWGDSSGNGKLVNLSNNKFSKNGKQYYKIPADFDGFKVLRMKSSFSGSSSGYPNSSYIEQESQEISSGVVSHIAANYNVYIVGDGGYNQPMTLTSSNTAITTTKRVLVYDEVGVDKKYLQDVSTTPSNNTPVANTNYELLDPLAQRYVNGRWVSYKGSSIAGQTNGIGELNLMYGQSAVFTGQFDVNSTMLITQSNTLYKPGKTGKVVDFNTPNGRNLSDYYTINNLTLNYSSSDATKDTSTTQGHTVGGVDTFSFANPATIGTDDKVQIEAVYTRSVNVGSLKITKQLEKPGETTSNEFTMQVEFTNVFGSTESVSDYSGIKIDGATSGLTLDKNGKFTMEAGTTVTIDGIPVGTVVKVTEQNPGNYFNSDAITISDGGVATLKSDGKTFTVTNVRKTGKITINKQFAADSAARDGRFTAKITFNTTTDNPENIDIKEYVTSYGDAIYYDNHPDWKTDGDGNDYFEFTIGQDPYYVEIDNVPYGIKYKIEEVLTGTQISEGWQEPTMTVDGGTGKVTYTKGDLQTFEGDVTYTITNNKQETVDICVEKAFAALNGTEKTETITEREEIAANRTVTFKVYIPQNSAPDFVTYTYYTKGGVANTKTVKKETDDYYFNWDPGKYNRRYCITVSDPDISLSTTSTKLLTLPKISGLTVVVAEDTTDKNWVPTYYDVTGTPVESDAVTFDGTTNQYNFKIVNKPAVTDTYTLKVRKDIINSETDDNHKPFKVNLKLKFSAADNSDVVQLMKGYDFKPEIWIANKPSSHPGEYVTKVTYKKNFSLEKVEWTYNESDKTMTCILKGLNVQEQETTRSGGTQYSDSEYRVDIPKAFADFECNAELVSAYEDLDGSVEINKNEWLDPTYKYNAESSSDGTFTNGKISDTGDNILTITNNRLNVEAYLTITKYIDSLHYGENDNAHRFAGGTGIPNIDSTTKPDRAPLYDPFHYLQYTQAEQLFEFKITEYDLLGEPQHEYHTFLKFGPDSTRLNNAVTYNENGINYYYSQSKMFKVKPGYSYTVEEVGANATQNTGISWRYKYDGNQVSTGSGVNYADGKCKYIGDRNTTTLESTFNFYNSRTKGSQEIESDQSSIINHIDYTGRPITG